MGGFPGFGNRDENDEEDGEEGGFGGFAGKRKYIASTKGIASKGKITINSGNITVRTTTAGAEGIEGKDGIVIRNQIAKPEQISALQAGLKHAVSTGLFKGAGRSYTNVSAHGCTSGNVEGGHRMELCGYFPSEDPLYTIMVILEKKSLPASAGGMCGVIMAQTIDTLVDYYDLKNGWIKDIND